MLLGLGLIKLIANKYFWIIFNKEEMRAWRGRKIGVWTEKDDKKEGQIKGERANDVEKVGGG